MNRTTLFLIVVMVMLIILPGCTLRNMPVQNGGSTQQAEITPAQNPEPAPAQQEPAAETGMAEAEAQPAEEIDYSITGQIERCGGDETCLAAVALEYEAPTLCGELVYPNNKQECYEQMAIKYRNVGYCNELYGYEREECIEAVEAS